VHCVTFPEINQAKEEFEKALAIDHEHVEAKIQLENLNRLLKLREKEAAAQMRMNEMAKVHKDGLDSFGKGKYIKALALFKKVLKIDPNHPEARRYASLSRQTLHKHYLKEGKDFTAKGEWEPAIIKLKKALDFEPSSKEALKLIQTAAARREMQKKVLSQNFYKEGLEEFLAGNSEKAKIYFEKSLEMDPTNEEAKRAWARAEQLGN